MPNSSADLLKRGEARWEQLLTERPDLAPAIDLQRALVTRLIELETVLERDGLSQLSLAPADISGKLARGIPVLRGEDISLPLALLGPLIVELCDHLARGGAGRWPSISARRSPVAGSTPDRCCAPPLRATSTQSGPRRPTWDLPPICSGSSPR